jgi:ATP-binding cassette subfamily B (MDR/TAP) protein 1
LYSSWKVALLVFAIFPLLAGASYIAIQMNQSKSARASQHYQEAGSVAYTTLSSIRTVLSLNAMEKMIRQYEQATQKAFESATGVLVKLGFWNGMITGSFTSLFAMIVLFGSFVMYRDVEISGCDPGGGNGDNPGCPVSGADVFGAMLGILFAGQSSSQVGNCGNSFQEARMAAFEALKIINRVPGRTPAKTIYRTDEGVVEAEDENVSSALEHGRALNLIKAILPSYEINPFARDGLKPEKVLGRLEFKNVKFSYPTRPSELILDGLNLVIPAGKKVALVGPR